METLRNFLKSITNKIKALYLLWFLIHFILFLVTLNDYGFTRYYNYKDDFFPFTRDNSISYFFNLSSYDYSEFLVYSLSPIFIYAIIYLWRKK